MNINLSEEQRHVILFALAHLAVERPHWDEKLASVAATMDERGEHCQPQLFFNFKLNEIDPLCQLRGFSLDRSSRTLNTQPVSAL